MACPISPINVPFPREPVVGALTSSDAFQQAALHEIREVAHRSFARGIRGTLIICVRNSSCRSQLDQAFLLPFIQAEFFHHGFRKPIAPQRNDKLPAALLKLGLGQAVLRALANHHDCPCAVFLDIACQKQRFTNPSVASNRSVGFSEPGRREFRWQLSWIPNFNAVREDRNLYRCR